MTEQQMRTLNEALAVATGALTIIMLARVVLGPDAFNRVRMRALRAASRDAKRAADGLTTFAARCDTAYHRIVNVTV